MDIETGNQINYNNWVRFKRKLDPVTSIYHILQPM